MENILIISIFGVFTTIFGGMVLFVISEVRSSKKHRKKHV